MAAASAGLATVEDIWRLQTQVDQMKDRLDFISPMLPVINFVQDYFQKVESEASSQLFRLRHAQGLRDGFGEQGGSSQLETVKLLHCITHLLVMQQHAGTGDQHGYAKASGGSGASVSPAMSQAEPRGAPSSALRRIHEFPVDGYPPQTVSSASSHPMSMSGSLKQEGPMRHDFEAQARSSSFLQRQPQVDRMRSADSTSSARLPERLPASASQSPASVTASPGMRSQQMGSTDSGRHTYVPSSPRTTAQHNPFEVVFMPSIAAEPGTGGTAGHLSEATVIDGLVLGRGSWASAYRQASGLRREALRLLCHSSIVTARELSDDLTVVSQEHIDECIQIATEMLKTWTMDRWAKQPDEAKKFFEASLTAMYQHRFDGGKP